MEIGTIETCLDRVLGFIEKADAKANTQLATCGLLLTAIAASGIGSTQQATCTAKVVLVLALLLLTSSMLFDLLVVYPRWFPEKKAASRIFFQSAHALEGLKEGIIKEFYTADNDDKYKEDMIGQIVENNRIASRKYKYLNVSSKLLMFGCAFSSLYILLSILG